MPELLQSWLTAQAHLRPASTAVTGNGERLSYLELEVLSNQLARILRAEGCKKGQRVCVLMPKSPRAIVALFGIYKADCIYVPLDTASPAKRLGTIVESCSPEYVLLASSHNELWKDVIQIVGARHSVNVGRMDSGPLNDAFDPADRFTFDDLAAQSGGSLEYSAKGSDPAQMLFTSGSTGIPKGVVIKHSNIIHFIEWATEYFQLGPSDRVSGHAPLHFDISIFDIFSSLATGAELHLVPPELSLSPHKLAQFIRTAELTQWLSVPSVLNYMRTFDVVSFGDFPSLKRLLWCGEVLSTSCLMYWMQKLPHVSFTNLYGPTETTIASSYYTVPRCPVDATTEIPIGRACPGEELVVLDQSLNPVPPNQIGDLYIRGVGVTPGYWRDPARTDSAFLADPSSENTSDRIYKTGDLARIGDDGLLYFCGRNDAQIKSRGYRIELGEIENALHSLGWLQEVAVVGIETTGFEQTMICCGYVPLPGVRIQSQTLRAELRRLVPSYMLPTLWRELKSLPKNPNGKIDRRSIKGEFNESAVGAARTL